VIPAIKPPRAALPSPPDCAVMNAHAAAFT
jgi:hypothetical protein